MSRSCRHDKRMRENANVRTQMQMQNSMCPIRSSPDALRLLLRQHRRDILMSSSVKHRWLFHISIQVAILCVRVIIQLQASPANLIPLDHLNSFQPCSHPDGWNTGFMAYIVASVLSFYCFFFTITFPLTTLSFYSISEPTEASLPIRSTSYMFQAQDLTFGKWLSVNYSWVS